MPEELKLSQKHHQVYLPTYIYLTPKPEGLKHYYELEYPVFC